MPPKNADRETKTKTNRTGSLWRILCLVLCSSDPVWAVEPPPKPKIELGGKFSLGNTDQPKLLMTCERWSEVTAHRDQTVADAANGTNSLIYRNTASPPAGVKITKENPTQIFVGTVKFVGAPGMLAIISDDGCTVSVKPHEPGAVWEEVLDKCGHGQSLNQAAFATLPFFFKPDTLYDVEVKYSQTHYIPKPGQPDIDGATLYACLCVASIAEVFELDQKWNKVPNPKKRPAYLNDFGLPVVLLRNYLFVATEPSTGKVELAVKTSPFMNTSGSGVVYLCGVRDTTAPDSGTSIKGPILKGSRPVSGTGTTPIDFEPTGDLKENEKREYLVVLGVDQNGDNSLSDNEVIPSPVKERFYIKAVTQADYDDSLDWLSHRDWDITNPVSRAFLRYFNGNSNSIEQALPLPALVLNAASVPNPSHIAGSSYTQIDGNTEILNFKLPEGSKASNAIEATFDRRTEGGLRSVIYNLWNENKAALAAPFNANAALSTSTSDSICIPEGTSVSFYGSGMDDLHRSLGEAQIVGTVKFGMRRDPLNPLKIILTSLTIDAVVKDVYDFDWTRPTDSPSRQGATVQIGWQPPTRKGGRIFATETVVKRVYNNDRAIERFNNSYQIILPNTNPGPPIVPPKPTE